MAAGVRFGHCASAIALLLLAGCDDGAPKRSLMVSQDRFLHVAWSLPRGLAPDIRYRFPRSVVALARPERRGGTTLSRVLVRVGQPIGDRRWFPHLVDVTNLPQNDDTLNREFGVWSARCDGFDACVRDGVFGGLQRYTKVTCGLQPHQILRKDADDPSPDGCVRDRTSAYYTSTFSYPQGELGIGAWCSAGFCTLHVPLHGRRLETTLIPMAEMDHATEIARFMRAQIAPYIVQVKPVASKR